MFIFLAPAGDSNPVEQSLALTKQARKTHIGSSEAVTVAVLVAVTVTREVTVAVAVTVTVVVTVAAPVLTLIGLNNQF